MKTLLTGILLIALALWVGWVALLASPAPRDLIWTVTPATSAPPGSGFADRSANIHGCFGCLDVSAGGAVGEGER